MSVLQMLIFFTFSLSKMYDQGGPRGQNRDRRPRISSTPKLATFGELFRRSRLPIRPYFFTRRGRDDTR